MRHCAFVSIRQHTSVSITEDVDAPQLSLSHPGVNAYLRTYKVHALFIYLDTVGRALSTAATPDCENLACARAYETHTLEEAVDALKEADAYSQ